MLGFCCWLWSCLVLVSFCRLCTFLPNLIFVSFVTRQTTMILTCFLPGVTHNFDVLFSVSIVCVSPLQRFHRLFCNVLFLDFNEAVPETERLDSKALKTRAQLSLKNRRQRPSRTRLYDSVSSTDGEDSLERKVSTPTAFWRATGLYSCSYSLLIIMIFLQPDSVFQLKTAGIVHFFVS